MYITSVTADVILSDKIDTGIIRIGLFMFAWEKIPEFVWTWQEPKKWVLFSTNICVHVCNEKRSSTKSYHYALDIKNRYPY